MALGRGRDQRKQGKRGLEVRLVNRGILREEGILRDEGFWKKFRKVRPSLWWKEV